MFLTKTDKKALVLAERLAVPCADNGETFTDDTRIQVIKEALKGSRYKSVKSGPLFRMYAQKPLEKIQGTLRLVSSHVDCLQHSAVFEKKEKRIHGIFDNAITNAACVLLMQEGELPEDVVFVFTGDEESESRGAKAATEYLKSIGKKFAALVLDVTHEGWKDKAAFTLENVFLRADEGKSGYAYTWVKKILELAGESGSVWRYVSSHMTAEDDPDHPAHIGEEDILAGLAPEITVRTKKGELKEAEQDETWEYDELGISCFSLCLPCDPGDDMHGEKGFDIRKRSYFAYVRMLYSVLNTELYWLEMD